MVRRLKLPLGFGLPSPPGVVATSPEFPPEDSGPTMVVEGGGDEPIELLLVGLVLGFLV